MKQSKRFSIDERVLKWTKRTKKYNNIITGIILIIALVLLVLAIRAQSVHSVKAVDNNKNNIKMTYLGNIELSKHIRKNNLDQTFDGIKDILKSSDFSTATLNVSKLANKPADNIKANLKNVEFLHGLSISSLNLNNTVMDNVSVRNLEDQTERKFGYDFLTGNGSNPINSKTIQQEVKGKKIANLSFTDVMSDYEDSLKNTTSISLEPHIFVPLVQKLKEKNDFVVVNVDWGITNERSVTTRQKQFAHALADAGADVIIGHNSVTQEIEQYKNTTVFYSLGNVTSESFLSKNKQSIAVQQTWDGNNAKFMVTPIKSESGKITQIQPTKMEEIKLLNELNSKSVKLKKEDGGYVYEHKK